MSSFEVERRELALKLTKEKLKTGKAETSTLITLISEECWFSSEYALKVILQMIDQGIITSDLEGMLMLSDNQE